MKDAKVFEIFPQPILMVKCDFHDEVKEVVNSVIETMEPVTNQATPGLKHYGNILNSSILYMPEFSKMKNWVEECAKEFAVRLMGYDILDSVMCSDSWINVCDAGGYQYPHYHSNSLISGTYYVNFDPEKHSPLSFKNRKNQDYPSSAVLKMDIKEGTKFNVDANISPESGILVLWESHLMHGFMPSDEGDRISIAMNFVPNVIYDGNYGFKLEKIVSDL